VAATGVVEGEEAWCGGQRETGSTCQWRRDREERAVASVCIEVGAG
jgi:hypothetical protein